MSRRPKPPSARRLVDCDEAVVVFRCQDPELAARAALDLLAEEYEGGDVDLQLEAGWYRINPCNCGDGHRWDLGTAYGPGSGNSRGYLVTAYDYVPDEPRSYEPLQARNVTVKAAS